MAKQTRYLLTVDSATGAAVKLERLGEAGDLTEVPLSTLAVAIPGAQPMAGAAAPPASQPLVINIYMGGSQQAAPLSVSVPGLVAPGAPGGPGAYATVSGPGAPGGPGAYATVSGPGAPGGPGAYATLAAPGAPGGPGQVSLFSVAEARAASAQPQGPGGPGGTTTAVQAPGEPDGTSGGTEGGAR